MHFLWSVIGGDWRVGFDFFFFGPSWPRRRRPGLPVASGVRPSYRQPHSRHCQSRQGGFPEHLLKGIVEMPVSQAKLAASDSFVLGAFCHLRIPSPVLLCPFLSLSLSLSLSVSLLSLSLSCLSLFIPLAALIPFARPSLTGRDVLLTRGSGSPREMLLAPGTTLIPASLLWLYLTTRRSPSPHRESRTPKTRPPRRLPSSPCTTAPSPWT